MRENDNVCVLTKYENAVSWLKYCVYSTYYIMLYEIPIGYCKEHNKGGFIIYKKTKVSTLYIHAFFWNCLGCDIKLQSHFEVGGRWITIYILYIMSIIPIKYVGIRDLSIFFSTMLSMFTGKILYISALVNMIGCWVCIIL